jgi:hypothetical protein
MIREHPEFDPGWNKIFNINGVVRDDPGSKALPASSLALHGTTGVTLGKHRSSAGDDPGYDIAGRAPVNAGRAPLYVGRAPEDDEGASFDPGRAPAKPGS